MRVAVVSVPHRRMEVPEYVKALVKGVESMGHRVEIIDAWTQDGFRLPSFEYVIVCAEAIKGWGGKMPLSLPKVLTSGPGLVGKRGAAFIKKTGPLFTQRSLANLMKAMEKEGMRINWSDILLNTAQAEAMGKRITP
ncbi:MAG: hypothetical protein FWH12_04545 [Treponema sp.]|nr:hypothetical protein [Treponema sp.]